MFTKEMEKHHTKALVKQLAKNGLSPLFEEVKKSIIKLHKTEKLKKLEPIEVYNRTKEQFQDIVISKPMSDIIAVTIYLYTKTEKRIGVNTVEYCSGTFTNPFK